MTTKDTQTSRYGVVKHHDNVGEWYTVIDRQSVTPRNAVYATRKRNEAHSHADTLNRRES